MALSGGWTSGDSFALLYREVAGIDNFELHITFRAETVDIDLIDPSGYFNGTISGRLQP